MPKFLRKLFRQQPKVRKSADESDLVTWFQRSHFVTTLIYTLTILALLALCFAGVSVSKLSYLPNQIANTRIIASVNYSYVSTEQTRLAREQIRDRIPPVYKLNPEESRHYQNSLREILAALEKFPNPGPHEIAAAIAPINSKGIYHINPDDLATLLAPRAGTTPKQLLEDALITLREIQEQGIYDPSQFPGDQTTLLQILTDEGQITEHTVLTTEDALRKLRINLSAENTDPTLASALNRILRSGLKPNLAFDLAATKTRQNQALEKLQPVLIRVQQGQVIIEPGQRITPEQHEMLIAQQQYLQDHPDISPAGSIPNLPRLLLVFAMLLACYLGIRIENRHTLSTNGRRLHIAALILSNIVLIRLTYELINLPTFADNPTAASILPYLAPTALAPLIATLLTTPRVAVFIALLTSLASSAIFGNRLDLLVITFLASLIAISSAQNNTKRLKLLRSSLFAGLTVAFFALTIGLLEHMATPATIAHAATAIAAGLLTGIFAIGCLPLFEALFQRVTDITLLELTDYNHPLLRLMQIEAPGTYHHSLVVAQLSENAAAAIQANPLLARVCALYHDIGKTEKPEYFSENQTAENPHDEANPSLSALIIKSHVKDGVDIALKNRLPRVLIRAIQQHHGTSLIRYFYNRAQQEDQRVAGNTAPLPGLEPAPTSETTYRYDGPKPDFKESAILHLADQVEAASRSLRRITPQHLGELIDQITNHSIEDGQLDESPLTVHEIKIIKTQFAKTLVTMLHTRIAYPGSEKN